MTEKKNEELPVDSEDDEDDDYAPTKNDDEAQSNESEDSEEETNVIEEQPSTIKPYDPSKVDELWKNFTSSSSKASTTIVNTEKKTFDYAGEQISVSVPSTSSLKRPAPAATSNSILDRLGIGKKPKLSTLEKSRLDWSAHKDTESLNDDLDSHRRGKNSYVEKQAFLERSEQRQHDHYLTHVKKK